MQLAAKLNKNRLEDTKYAFVYLNILLYTNRDSYF